MLARTSASVGIFDQQAASDHARAEDHHRGEDDFPGVHQIRSVVESCSAAASTVFSNSWDKSVPGALVVEEIKDQALRSNMMAMHGATPRQRARDHKAQ